MGRQAYLKPADPFASVRHPRQSLLRRHLCVRAIPSVGPSGEIRTRSRLMPQDAWRITIPNHHEGYISEDQFVANRERLTANRTNGEGLAGPVRDGLCLLQGLLLCGFCGRRLGVRYTGNGGVYPIYQCVWKHREALASRACLTVPATPLDQAITERLVGAITPVTIELALAALTSLEERDREIGAQWWMRIERARYDADLAERRYEAVDPSNRLIAATLETRWNDAMQRLHDLKAELAAFEQKTMRAVTAEQKRQILQLADRQADRTRHCQMVALQTSHTNAQASARVARHVGMPSGLI